MKRAIPGVLALLFGACGHATIWSQEQRGGVMALHGSEGPAMDDAKDQMSAHCGAGGYEIVRRDTVVIGEQAVTNHSQAAAGRSTTANTSTSVYEMTETRLTYVCR
jgi:hypothetical protein